MHAFVFSLEKRSEVFLTPYVFMIVYFAHSMRVELFAYAYLRLDLTFEFTFLVNRYNDWLEKLADISLRTSAAYGIWNCSFNTLYHSTQVMICLFLLRS